MTRFYINISATIGVAVAILNIGCHIIRRRQNKFLIQFKSQSIEEMIHLALNIICLLFSMATLCHLFDGAIVCIFLSVLTGITIPTELWLTDKTKLSFKFKGLENANYKHALKVFGFIRRYSQIHNLYIPDDIICTCLTYYDDTPITFIRSFYIHFSQRQMLELSGEDNQTIKGIYREYERCVINCLDSNCHNGYERGIHYMAIRYEGERGYAEAEIGVTYYPKMDHDDFYLRYNVPGSYKIDCRWKSVFEDVGDILIVKLDLDKHVVYFYHEKQRIYPCGKSKIQLIQRKNLKRNKRYYFVMSIRSYHGFRHKYSIVRFDDRIDRL